MASKFLMRHPEKEMFNQYWYSENTISAIIAELESLASQGYRDIACVSTPSIYFSLPDSLKQTAKVFDIDSAFQRDPNYVNFDFNQPENIPQQLLKSFDVIIIDPPFITFEVWSKYSVAAKMLAKEGVRYILSSTAENANMLRDLLAVSRCNFKPSIPHLVYQYNFFTNYDPVVLNQSNSEIPDD